jgi:hypothetical protein
MPRVLAVLPLLLLVATPALGQDRAPESELAALPPVAPVLSASEGAEGDGGGTILRSALLGGAGGAVIGLGVALIQNDNYGRDIAIGAGAGLVIGGVVGLSRTFGNRRALPEDGLSSVERNPIIQARTVGVGGRF